MVKINQSMLSEIINAVKEAKATSQLNTVVISDATSIHIQHFHLPYFLWTKSLAENVKPIAIVPAGKERKPILI